MQLDGMGIANPVDNTNLTICSSSNSKSIPVGGFKAIEKYAGQIGSSP